MKLFRKPFYHPLFDRDKLLAIFQQLQLCPAETRTHFELGAKNITK